jgi:hypothetical protein
MSPRPKKYASEQEAYEAKKTKSRARYWAKKGTTDRERVGIINYKISAADIGLTIRQIKDRLKHEARTMVIETPLVLSAVHEATTPEPETSVDDAHV